VLVEVLAAQAAVGYVQYFTRIPAALVAVHIAGSTAVWASAVSLCCGLTMPVPAGRPADDATPGILTSREGILSRT
jgi:cytochrome c oxidase assembly protein subunit 15